MKKISILGARTHNLKNINVSIPRDSLVVVTGVSGSGKSSLAFDTLFAEGQRRYVESLSAYARQFLQVMDKPDVDAIEGLSPTIAIDQKGGSHNPRSTVGTITEIQDYLRVLFARIGKPHCPKHGIALKAQSTQSIVAFLLSDWPNKRVAILSPVVIERRGEYVDLLHDLASKGFSRVRIDGDFYDIETPPPLAKKVKHTIEIVVDRVRINIDNRQRLVESIDTACRFADGRLHLQGLNDNAWQVFSTRHACPTCGYSPPELEPKLFSFNSPASACRTCDGLGVATRFDSALIVENPELSLAGGAIRGWDQRNSHHFSMLQTLAKHCRFSLEVPFHRLTKKQQQTVLFGIDEELTFVNVIAAADEKTEKSRRVVKKKMPFIGIVNHIRRQWQDNPSPQIREALARYMTTMQCHDCQGARLLADALAITIADHNIHQLGVMPLNHLLTFFDTLKLSTVDENIAKRVVREVKQRVGFLVDIGLGYLSLGRTANTLSGGESQRIRLASQIGTGLTGVTYVLDEPSIGLHQRDNKRLLDMMKRLRDLKNTVIIVEHDEEAIRAADYVIDMGIGAGKHGGKVVAIGSPKKVASTVRSLTGQYLRRERQIEVPTKRRKASNYLTIHGARANNLKGGDFAFPLHVLTCITGVSGSGKSTLVRDILTAAGLRYLYSSNQEVQAHDSISGWEHINRLIMVNQSPIGRTPRSNPTTYTGMFTAIRDYFAHLPLARERGYGSGRFSFNVTDGRCDNCEGCGLMRIEMHFLPDIYVNCDVCGGSRYKQETLEVRYRGKNIADVLAMTVDTAADFFENLPAIRRRLKTLQDVGLGYIQLGQSATTLSGGEAQRVKLSLELSKQQCKDTLYILDEPTTGLHFHDIKLLLAVLQQLVDAGNSVIVIEHNLDVIKTADWVIDLGPEGGDAGGELIASGTPEAISRNKNSVTGKYLKPLLVKHV